MSDEPKRIHTREEVARVAIAVANPFGKCAIDCSECTTVSQCNRCVDSRYNTSNEESLPLLYKTFQMTNTGVMLLCRAGVGPLLLGHSQV